MDFFFTHYEIDDIADSIPINEESGPTTVVPGFCLIA
jgi:hypothetical protein